MNTHISPIAAAIAGTIAALAFFASLYANSVCNPGNDPGFSLIRDADTGSVSDVSLGIPFAGTTCRLKNGVFVLRILN